MPMQESERVIVALDFESAEQARQLVAQLGDQARTATPAAAIRSGSTHVVMGRSITQAADPAAAFAAACTQVAAALAGTGEPAEDPAAKDKRS